MKRRDIMKRIISLVVVSLVVVAFAAVSYAAEYVVKKGDNLTKVAKLTEHKIPDLIQMNLINHQDLIYAGQKLTYLSEYDKLRAKMWSERRRTELDPSDKNYEFFGWVLEDLKKNHLRYSINEPSGTHYSLILDFAKANGRVCRVSRSLKSKGEWVTEQAAFERLDSWRTEAFTSIECR